MTKISIGESLCPECQFEDGHSLECPYHEEKQSLFTKGYSMFFMLNLIFIIGITVGTSIYVFIQIFK